MQANHPSINQSISKCTSKFTTNTSEKKWSKSRSRQTVFATVGQWSKSHQAHNSLISHRRFSIPSAKIGIVVVHGQGQIIVVQPGGCIRIHPSLNKFSPYITFAHSWIRSKYFESLHSRELIESSPENKIFRKTNKPTNRSINQSINQSIDKNQPINQSIDQSINIRQNQAPNQSTHTHTHTKPPRPLNANK